MKKAILHIVLLSYTVFMLKPVLPYITDAVDHVFFYAKHMAKVHYENGKYHVHYETAKEAKEERSDKTSSSIKKDTAASEYVLTAAIENNRVDDHNNTQYNLSGTSSVIDGTFKNNYPPPRS